MSNDIEIDWPEDYFERREIETPDKGWLEVRVRINDMVYTLNFYDLTRAAQELKDARAHGLGYFAQPGLIVIDEVNTAAVHRAVTEMHRDGFFDASWPRRNHEL